MRAARGEGARSRRGACAAIVVGVLALGAAACGDDGDAALAVAVDQPQVSESSTTTVSEDDLVPFCEDVPPVGPVEHDPTGPPVDPHFGLMGALGTYTDAHADTFAGMWSNPPAGSAVVVFTDDPAPHEATIAGLRPSPADGVDLPPTATTATTTVAESGVTVVVVQAAYSEADLIELVEELMAHEELGAYGGGVLTMKNRVVLSLEVADVGTRAAIAELAPIDAVCVEGPAEAPVPIDPGSIDLFGPTVPEDLEDVEWWLDSAYPAPAPDDTELHILAMGHECSNGEPLGDRLIGPQVQVTDEEVAIALAALPLPPGVHTCPGNPADVVLVTLDEPLGDRIVVDGMDAPPRSPASWGEPSRG